MGEPLETGFLGVQPYRGSGSMVEPISAGPAPPLFHAAHLFCQLQSPGAPGLKQNPGTCSYGYPGLPLSLKFILFSSPEIPGTHSSAGPGLPQPDLGFRSCLYLAHLPSTPVKLNHFPHIQTSYFCCSLYLEPLFPNSISLIRLLQVLHIH